MRRRFGRNMNLFEEDPDTLDTGLEEVVEVEAEVEREIDEVNSDAVEVEVEVDVAIIDVGNYDFKLEEFLKTLSQKESKLKAIKKSQELGNSNWIGHSRYRDFYKSLR